MTDEQKKIVLEHTFTMLKANGGRIVYKVGWFWKTIHYAVMILTLGRNRNFLNNYYTTLGNRVGVPEGFDEACERNPLHVAAVIEHENIHITQAKRWGRGYVWLGYIPYSICYLLLPLPMFFSYFRYLFEREAYAHGINFYLQFDPGAREQRINHAVAVLCGGEYAWTWILEDQIRKWFEANVHE